MNVKYGHLKTDGKTIQPCCSNLIDEMEHGIVGIIQVDFDPEHPTMIICRGISANKCPFCGAKLEYVDKLDGE